jgi:hypothetical protein
MTNFGITISLSSVDWFSFEFTVSAFSDSCFALTRRTIAREMPGREKAGFGLNISGLHRKSAAEWVARFRDLTKSHEGCWRDLGTCQT